MEIYNILFLRGDSKKFCLYFMNQLLQHTLFLNIINLITYSGEADILYLLEEKIQPLSIILT
jgi:hypothetical protein